MRSSVVHLHGATACSKALCSLPEMVQCYGVAAAEHIKHDQAGFFKRDHEQASNQEASNQHTLAKHC